MDWLTFISTVIESLAWPGCATAIALLFRAKIAELLGRIVKGKIPGGEFEFSEVAKGQLQVADQTGVKPDDSESSSGEIDLHSLDLAYELLDTLPRAAVIEGWRQLHRLAADRVLEFYDGESSSSGYPDDYPFRNIPAARLADYLRSCSILTPDQLAVFDELRRLRNQAVHDNDVVLDEKKAKQYLVLTELLSEKLVC